MALIERLRVWVAGNGPRAVETAEAILRRSEQAGLPPAVTGLGPRRRAAFDRLVDALNRLPRPLTVIGTLALIGAALAAPAWFAERMEALSRMPEGLWWIIGAVLSLHFGARFQAHAQAHEREIVEAVVAQPELALPVKVAVSKAVASKVTPSTEAPFREAAFGEAEIPRAAAPGPDAEVRLATLETGPNAALAEWKAGAATAAG